MYHVFNTGARGGDSGRLPRSPSNFASGRAGDRASVSVVEANCVASGRRLQCVCASITVCNCVQNLGGTPGRQYRLPTLLMFGETRYQSIFSAGHWISALFGAA